MVQWNEHEIHLCPECEDGELRDIPDQCIQCEDEIPSTDLEICNKCAVLLEQCQRCREPVAIDTPEC